MAGEKSVTCLLTLACFLTLISLGLIAVAFGTDYWQDITVDRAQLAADPTLSTQDHYIYFSRHRGLFRVCVPSNESTFFSSPPADALIVDGNCVWDSGMFLPAEREWGDENMIREHLLRLDLALFSLSMFLLIVALVMNAVSCWDVAPNNMIGAGVSALMAGFAGVGGMAVFHGLLQIENSDLSNISTTKGIFAAYWDETGTLGLASKWQYGWSYILCWVGCGVSLITSIVFLSAGSKARRSQGYDEKEPLALMDPSFLPPPMMGPPMMGPQVVAVPHPVPVPVPVPVYPSMPRMGMPRPDPGLPMLTYPTMPNSKAGSQYDHAFYQTQPPAYPNGANFSAAHSHLST